MKLMTFRILLFCFILLPFISLAQEKQLRGVVRDQKESLIGVAVFWQNAEGRPVYGVTTNENGEYALTVPENANKLNLVFQFIGMKTEVRKYTGKHIVNIIMQEEASLLDEVVVRAQTIDVDQMGVNAKNTGVARQKIDLGDLQDMAVTSVGDMLQGKLTNVDIVAGSGDPGTKSSIRIRGTSSLNASNEPLIVVDDVPKEADISEDFDFGTADVEDFGALLQISPSDIQSIEVLKDAAATALWGSQAANGVLLVTTLRGKKSAPSFSISQKITANWEPKPIKMLNAEEYVTLMQDALWNRVQYKGFQPQDMKYLTDYDDIRYNPAYEYYDEFNVQTDWLSLLVQNPISSETNFSMSGGGDAATYRFSVGYMSEKGTTIGTKFNRISATLNLDYELSKRFKVSSSFKYLEGNRDQPFGLSNVRGTALNKMPNMSPWVLDDEGNRTDVYFNQPSSSIQGKQSNPVAVVNDSRNNTINRNVSAQFNLVYQIIKGLKATSLISFSMSSNKNKSFNPAHVTGKPWTDNDYNKATDGTNSGISLYWNSKLMYNKAFGKNSITVTGQATVSENNSSSYAAEIAGIGSGEVADPSANGRVVALRSGDSKSRSIGLTGNMHWRWDARYSITAGVRSEASSKTGRNSRWGVFKSLSAQWTMKNESFFQDIDWLSDARLNLSWGQSGRAPSGSFTYVGTLTPEDSYMGHSAIKPNSMQLNKLKWEISTDKNVALNLSFLQDRLIVNLDYYIKQTDDLLQKDMKISSTTGFPDVGWFNSGKTQNKGWEVSVNMPNIIRINDFRVSLSNLNIARNRNSVLELPSNRVEESASESNGTYANRVVEGKPLGSFYGYNCLGVYQNTNETYARNANGEIMTDVYGRNVVTSIFGTKDVYPGDAKYDDKNGDGVIDKYDMVYLGNAMPILTGGGGLSLAYKGLTLRASFHFRVGQKIINRTKINTESMSNGNNQRKSVLKRWRYEGDKTVIPRALYSEGYNYLGSDRFVEDNSFLKCKDVTLKYNLPRHMLKKWSINSANIYVTTYNLFTITKYTGQDPETALPSGFSQLAEDSSLTPRSRRMALGLSFNF